MTTTPFVIVSHLRSGTHMLRTALESHPAVRCQAEPFNSDNPNLPYPLETPTREILDTWVYTPQPPEILVNGFVLHSYHPLALRAFGGIRENPRWADVWDILEGMTDLRVIFLYRQNLLRRHLSHVLARRRWYWHAWNAEKVDEVTHLGGRRPPEDQIGTKTPEVEAVVLDRQNLIDDFEEILELRERARCRFAHHATHEVRYETMCSQYVSTCAGILSFLQLPERPIKPAMRKIERRPLSAAIANYAELKASFEETAWAEFFDEP